MTDATGTTTYAYDAANVIIEALPSRATILLRPFDFDTLAVRVHSLAADERLAEATAPDGTRLTLIRHDGAYLIRADGVELMSTRRHLSEDGVLIVVTTLSNGTVAAPELISPVRLGA